MGIQERLVLQRMAQEAQEKGEPIPDIPGIREAMEDKVRVFSNLPILVGWMSLYGICGALRTS